tara:strand:+ start:3236 stop:3355 length:120 start_codon:yes stop_codon:yes gene_type:complete
MTGQGAAKLAFETLMRRITRRVIPMKITMKMVREILELR